MCEVVIERYDPSRTRMPLYPDGREIRKRGLKSEQLEALPSIFNVFVPIKGFWIDYQEGEYERNKEVY